MVDSTIIARFGAQGSVLLLTDLICLDMTPGAAPHFPNGNLSTQANAIGMQGRAHQSN